MAKGSKPKTRNTAKAILTDPLGEAMDRFKVDSAGVWRKVPAKDGGYRLVWLCARVEVFARTRTADNEAWGSGKSTLFRLLLLNYRDKRLVFAMSVKLREHAFLRGDDGVGRSGDPGNY